MHKGSVITVYSSWILNLVVHKATGRL